MSAQFDKALLAIREQAAEWVIRLGAPDTAHGTHTTFSAWLRTSPIHVREYLRAEAAWLAVRGVAQHDRSDVSALLAAGQTNVVDLQQSPRAAGTTEVTSQLDMPVQQPLTRFRRRTMALAVAATVLLAIGAALALVLVERVDHSTYATAVGEMRRVVLEDGSAVELNTHSRIRVVYTDTARDIHLTRGEAFFSVARDTQRPFRVRSDEAVIRALGTQFSVYRKPGRPGQTGDAGKLIVTVVEGKVAVSQGRQAAPEPAGKGTSAIATGAKQQAPPAAVELSAGHQVVIDSSADSDRRELLATANVDAAGATAWRQRRLIFHNEPLAEVVAEFNRYNRQQLVVEDPALAATGISGVFDADKPQGLVGFLSANGEVRVVEQGARLLLTAREST